MAKNTVEIVITPGDPDGIGPEVTEKALLRLRSKLSRVKITVVGSRVPYKRTSPIFKMKNVAFLEPPVGLSAGKQSGWCIETATRLVQKNTKQSALVTGPISKENLQKGGYPYHGHTDFLAALTQTPSVTMVLANQWFRVALVTTHLPLQQVSSFIRPETLSKVFEDCYAFSIQSLKRKKPRIAILGLNPHAGENGILGAEEKEVIIPTIEMLRKKYPSAMITGPHSADSFFATERNLKAKDRSDFIIAMYHDQGLIPVKLSDFKNCMNFTLGLPLVRTSVDHGTAFDLAGKNKADPSSMIYAIEGAKNFLNQRSTS